MSGYPWRDMAADERRRAASRPDDPAIRQAHLTRAAEWEALAEIEQGLADDNNPEGTMS